MLHHRLRLAWTLLVVRGLLTLAHRSWPPLFYSPLRLPFDETPEGPIYEDIQKGLSDGVGVGSMRLIMR